MDAGAWIALLTFVFTVLCGLVSVVWIAAMKFGKVWQAFSRVSESFRNVKRRLRRLEEAAGIKGERDSDVLPMEDSA